MNNRIEKFLVIMVIVALVVVIITTLVAGVVAMTSPNLPSKNDNNTQTRNNQKGTVFRVLPPYSRSIHAGH